MTVADLYDFLRAQYADRKGFAWYDRGNPAFVSDLRVQQWRIVRAPGDVAVCSVAGFWSIDLDNPAAVVAAADRPLASGEYFVTLTPQGAGQTGLTAEDSGPIKVSLEALARVRPALYKDAGIARITGRTIPREQLAAESAQAGRQAAQTARDNARADRQASNVGQFGLPDVTIPIGNLAASIVEGVSRALGLGAAAFLGQLPPVVVVLSAVGVVGLGVYVVRNVTR
jgi:hypothetical protein